MALLIVVVPVAYALSGFAPQASTDETDVTVPVVRATLPIVVTAGGELQSGETVDAYCEIEGETKIVEMLPEGTQVTDGQVVMRLDPSSVNVRLAGQEVRVKQADALAKAAQETLRIEENLGASKVAQAQLALTLAKLDRRKYEQGDYGVELNDLKGSVALAEAALQEAEDTAEFYRDLVKKGFRTPEQLQAKEQAVKRAEYTLNRDREKLQVLENFTRERQLTELTAKSEEAERELERAKSSSEAAVAKARTDYEVADATAGLERQQLDKLRQQFEQCEVRAAKDGTVVYASGEKSRIELGATVHFKQKLFSIPDMTQMQVEAWIHESVVKQVQPGLKAEIRIEAYPNVRLSGTVQGIANFYDGTRHWVSGGVKEYSAIVRLNDVPDLELKPGMTAEVRIVADEIHDALIIPLQAVVPRDGEYFCYVQAGSGFNRRSVTIGSNNENYVQIVKGVSDADRLALDARQRLAHELESRNSSGDAKTAKDSSPESTATTSDDPRANDDRNDESSS